MWRLSTNCSRKKQNNHTQHQTLIPKCPKSTQNTIVHCYFLFIYTEVCVEVGDMIWYDMTWFLSKVYFGVNRTFKIIEVSQISSVWISGWETRREVNKLSLGLDFKYCLHHWWAIIMLITVRGTVKSALYMPMKYWVFTILIHFC